MSGFVEDHVRHRFGANGFIVSRVEGDRGGVVQGDGLEIQFMPDFVDLASRFTSEPDIARAVKEAGRDLPNRFSVYGGSVSIGEIDAEAFPEGFIDFVKEKAEQLYYQVQREVNAYFEAQDPKDDDREWSEGLRGYVGVVDEFATEAPDGSRNFIRVLHIARENYNPYEYDDGSTQAAVEDILDGKVCHGDLAVITFDIEPDCDGCYDREFSQDAYEGAEFPAQEGINAGFERGMVWEAENYRANALAEAIEVLDHNTFVDALSARAEELKTAPGQDADTPKPGL